MKQIPLPIGLTPRQSFDNFSSGMNGMNVALLRGLSSAADLEGVARSPVYLWGETGSGKTHLLCALAQQWQVQGGRVTWLSASSHGPWLPEDVGSLIVLDDCDGFDAEQQHAAFSMFVAAAGLGSQVLAAGRLPPVDLPLRDDLRSRLGWGHVLALKSLTEAEARAVFRKAADERGIFLSDDVMDHLLTRFSRDMKSLMAMLEQLDEFALSQKRAVTVPLLKKMLQEAVAT